MSRKLLIIICLLSTVFIAYGQKKKKKHSKKEETKTETVVADTIDYKQIGSPMPPVRFIKDDGTIITNRTLSHKGSTMFIMFNPTCEHCQEEALYIIKDLDVFKNTRILFTAAANMQPYLSYFEAVTHYQKYPKIEVGLDSAKFIDKTFHYMSLPQINIYNKEHKLTKVFTGEVPVDSLKPYLD